MNAEFRKQVINVIPMSFLIANDLPGATGPTEHCDVVQAIRDQTAAARRVAERCKKAETLNAELLEAMEAVMPLLGRAESNASGNPEFDDVGPRVAGFRVAISKAREQRL
jgi:hypothetical protein